MSCGPWLRFATGRVECAYCRRPAGHVPMGDPGSCPVVDNPGRVGPLPTLIVDVDAEPQREGSGRGHPGAHRIADLIKSVTSEPVAANQCAACGREATDIYLDFKSKRGVCATCAGVDEALAAGPSDDAMWAPPPARDLKARTRTVRGEGETTVTIDDAAIEEIGKITLELIMKELPPLVTELGNLIVDRMRENLLVHLREVANRASREGDDRLHWTLIQVAGIVERAWA